MRAGSTYRAARRNAWRVELCRQPRHITWRWWQTWNRQAFTGNRRQWGIGK